uniref:Uncharacterized protein n=1 Tax=Rhizophora mucronata TaxID=61149 RepID=A0A2P2QTN3_RHIMU
MNKEKHEKQI